MLKTNFTKKLIDFGKELSEEIVKIQNSNFEVSSKSDKSPLTEADLYSNKEIKKFLNENSDIKNFISEEDKEIPFEVRKDWNLYWVIDPIDGTKEFVKGGDDFCVNIALCEGNSPIFGCVLQPKTKDCYHAFKGKGAFKNNKKIKTKPQSKPLRVVASKSHLNNDTKDFLNVLSNELEYELEVVNIGSSLKFCLIAEGLADVYPRFGPTMEWDSCAPHIIVTESGAEIYNVDTNDQNFFYNKENLLNPFFVVTNQLL